MGETLRVLPMTKPVTACRFCGDPITTGVFCPGCIALRRAAVECLIAASVRYVHPVHGPLVRRVGPHSYLLLQPANGEPWDIEEAA